MSSEEIKQIKETLKYYETTKTEPTYCEELITTGKLKRTVEEIERLNNIINELEKYCNNEINEGNKALEKLSEIYNSSDTESYIKGQQVKCKHILNKLQELKGDGSNV